MKHGSTSGRRAGRRTSVLLGIASLVAGLLLLVGLAGVLVFAQGEHGAARRTEGSAFEDAAAARQLPRPAPRVDAAAPGSAAKRRAGRAPEPVARPVRIAIPAIGVSAPVIPLGLDRAGALEVPQDFSKTGWWTGGGRPGERGPAVIAGHVDSHTGPAVFFRLGDLRRGDAITVERADGSHVRFRVARSEHYSKERFPTAKVYGPTGTPALRLITCSGTFDSATGHYLDNTVVYAGR